MLSVVSLRSHTLFLSVFLTGAKPTLMAVTALLLATQLVAQIC